MPEQIIGEYLTLLLSPFQEEANIQHETTLSPSNLKKLNTNHDIYNSNLSCKGHAHMY